MGMRPPRSCKRCYATAEPGTSLCAKHRTDAAEQDKARKAANMESAVYVVPTQARELYGRVKFRKW